MAKFRVRLRAKIQLSTGKKYLDLDDLLVFFKLSKEVCYGLTADQVYNYLIKVMERWKEETL